MRRLKKKPEALALIVALVGTMTILIVFVADLALARHRDLAEGQRRLQHFNLMIAEHTARTFEAIDVLLRETATDLSHNRTDWENWEANVGWEYIAQRHSRSMPQLRDLIIFDRYGNQRFISTYFPSPHINVKDRPYFAAIESGADGATFGPYVGRNSGRYTYAVARRVHGPNERFAGIVFAAIEPAYFQDFCWSNRMSDEADAVLTNARGEIVASCRPADLSRQSPIVGAKADSVLFGGKLSGYLPAGGITHGNGFLMSAEPVPGFSDLRIVAAIPEKALLAAWRTRLFELGTLVSLVAFVLIVGALMVRRQVRDMAAITAELAASKDNLESRVQSATLALAGQKDAAERANTAKSRFLAAASHDLRQPLHALSLFATDLQRQVQEGTPRELPRLSAQISASTMLLGELLDSLLDISRLDVAGIKPDIRPFPLQPVFERLAGSLRRAAADRNMTLRFHPTRQWVLTDPVMLERMIANLASNAVRYTPPGGRVLIGVRRRDGRLQIEVRDNGIGIAPEHQASIFAEFFQVGNTAREHNMGLGLGLSIVDRLARALKIEVGLRSRVGEGTTFSLSLETAVAGSIVPTSRPSSSRLERVHCIGTSQEVKACADLTARWDYSVSSVPLPNAERIPDGAVLIVDNVHAATLAGSLPYGMPWIVLTDGQHPAVPDGAHALPTPVRPAKLRALINQLQKTFSKSTP